MVLSSGQADNPKNTSLALLGRTDITTPLGKVAILGDYIPRKCGIATFIGSAIRNLRAEPSRLLLRGKFPKSCQCGCALCSA
jgi:hypothetical protein